MRDNNIQERNLINSLAGFFCGICLSLFIYYLLFTSQHTPFTFQGFATLHQVSPLIYVVDLLPGIAAMIAFIFNKVLSSRQNNFKNEIAAEREKIQTALLFSRDLIHGKLSKFKESIGKSNELAVSLEELRETLVKNKQAEDLRAREDFKRNWASEGLAMFGEILRTQEENMEDLAYKLISNLVKYLKANQGGFFLIEEDGKDSRYIQMIACHAYDRKKFANKRIEWGEGLIGTCVLEKKSIYLLDIPEDYLLITSGLGKAKPNILLLVPLLVNSEVQGVIEIASFTRFEDYQIEFIEKVAESIAMTLSNIKGNLRTTTLLKETRAQADELALQEERMRQNMEELKAIQEQAARQAEQFISFTNSVNHTMIRAEYDKEGYLLYANTKFLKKLGYSGNREVENKHISLFIHEKDKEWFNEIWTGLSQGGKHFEGYMKHVTKHGQDLWTMATYTSIRRDDGSVEKILFLAIDTTEQKKQSLDFESQIEALNRLSLKAEFYPDGKLLSTNELFNGTLKFSSKDMQEMSVFDFLDTKDLEAFTEIWEAIIIGKPHQGQLRLLTRYKEEKWFRVSFTSVNDMYDEVSKVVFLANEITNERIMEMESRKQNEQLKQQEEKLKLASIELNRKTEEKNKMWQEQINKLSSEIELYRAIMADYKEMICSFDNTGILVFMNKRFEDFWKIKSKDTIGLPASSVFKEVKNFPEEILSLTDPGKSKSFNKSTIELIKRDGKIIKTGLRVVSADISGKIIYTMSLTLLE